MRLNRPLRGDRIARPMRGFQGLFGRTAKPGRQSGRRDCAYRFAPLHRALAFIWFAMYSDVLQESAMIVQVGFLSACEVNGAPSATKRFLTSCVWQLAFTTDDLGSDPMRAPPSS